MDQDYADVTNRAGDFLADLMKERGIMYSADATGKDIIALQPELDEYVKRVFPDLSGQLVIIQASAPPDRGLGYWIVEMKIIDQGSELWREIVDFDYAPHTPLDHAILRSVGVDPLQTKNVTPTDSE